MRFCWRCGRWSSTASVGCSRSWRRPTQRQGGDLSRARRRIDLRHDTETIMLEPDQGHPCA